LRGRTQRAAAAFRLRSFSEGLGTDLGVGGCPLPLKGFSFRPRRIVPDGEEAGPSVATLVAFRTHDDSTLCLSG